MDTPIRILVVDHDDLFREGLSVLFARDPSLKIVGRASTGAEGAMKARRLQPDVVLTELRLPDMDGAALARTIRADAPEARIAIMTKRFSRPELMGAISAGVRGYVTKDVQIPTLIEAIREVARGAYYIPRESSPMLLEELAARNGAAPDSEDTAADRAKVTEREREVLQLLVQGATNRDIARRLSITENTVKVHLRNILDKLHLRNRQQAAAFAISAGLVKLNRDESMRRPAHRSDRMPASTWRRQAPSGG